MITWSRKGTGDTAVSEVQLRRRRYRSNSLFYFCYRGRAVLGSDNGTPSHICPSVYSYFLTVTRNFLH